MATQSFSTFRDAQATTIAALTPTAHAGVKFEHYRDQEDFRSWALANPAACFRRFAIEDLFVYDEPAISNEDVWWHTGEQEVVIAYPVDRRYGTDGARDQRDIMRADYYAIDTAIGARAGVYSSGHAVITSVSHEELGSVSFLVLTYTFRFWRGETSVAGITGPGSSTDNAVVRWDGTAGSVVQNSVVIIADTTGNMSGVGTLACGAITSTGNLVVSGTGTFSSTLSCSALSVAGNITVSGTVDGVDVSALVGAGTDNYLARYNSTNTIQPATSIVIDDSDNVSGMGTLGCGAITTSGNLTMGSNSITGTRGWIVDVSGDAGETISSSADSVMDFKIAGTTRIQAGTVSKCNSHWKPYSDNFYSIGNTDLKWKHAYLGTSLYIYETAAAAADIAGVGQLWVKNATPCELWFTDDAGTDTQAVMGSSLTDNAIVKGDGGAAGVQASGITVDDSDNVSSMGTLGCGAITTSGTLELGANTVTGTRGWKLDLGGDGVGSEAEYLTSDSDNRVQIFCGGSEIVEFNTGGITATQPWYGNVRTNDNQYVGFGSSLDVKIEWDTGQTNDSLLVGLGGTSNTVILTQKGDMGYNFAHANQTNPTWFIHSANQSTSEWISIAHNQTDGVIDCGAGTLNLGGTANVNFAGATRTASTVTHDAYVTLEVAGTAYNFMLGS
jgi:hypothetical protein